MTSETAIDRTEMLKVIDRIDVLIAGEMVYPDASVLYDAASRVVSMADEIEHDIINRRIEGKTRGTSKADAVPTLDLAILIVLDRLATTLDRKGASHGGSETTRRILDFAVYQVIPSA